jgi:hypothetical protein
VSTAFYPRPLTARAARRRAFLCALLAAALGAGPAAYTQPAPERPGPPPIPAASPAPALAEPPQKDPEEVKREARRHFEKGIALLKQGVWTVALAEFLLSRELYPTRNATNNAAVCLRKLERFDEALDMFETLLREYPDMPADDKLNAQRAVAELRSLVGTVDVISSEPGAAIVISGQNRGDYPPVAPLRVPAGTHVVRVFKEGFEPFETRVDVAGGLSVRIAAKLRKLTQSGRLRVTERSGMTLDVVVDNVVVGTTPWEGILSVGTHTVALQGKGKVGTPPASAPVKPQKLTTLSLRAEKLDASMRVEPTPAGASVVINSVNVGRGAWAGLLKSGLHQVEVIAEGFLPAQRQVNLARGEREVLTIKLERDDDSEFWRKPPKLVVDLSTALTILPSFGGDVADGCRSGCSRSIGLGGMLQLQAGYELGAGPGFGLMGGYLRAEQETTNRTASLVPVNVAPRVGATTDKLLLRGAMIGATAWFRFGEQYPALLRIGAGALLGSLRGEREGTFTATDGTQFKTYPVDDSPAARYLFIEPEVRVGFRFADRFVASAGVQALMLIAPSPPKWNDSLELSASTDGIATYPAETLSGGFVFGLAPGVSLRYDF